MSRRSGARNRTAGSNGSDAGGWQAPGWVARYPWRTVWFWEAGIQRILDRLYWQKKSFDLILVEDNAMGIYAYRTTTPRAIHRT